MDPTLRSLFDAFARACLCLSVTAAVCTFIYLPGDHSCREDGCDRVADLAPDAVDRVEFGLFTDEGFVPSAVVPLQVGVVFGWRLAVADDAPIAWREVLRAPAEPRAWLGEDFTVSSDNRSAIFDNVSIPEDGAIAHAWEITEGDPAGLHEMRVRIEGGRERVFHFVVR